MIVSYHTPSTLLLTTLNIRL